MTEDEKKEIASMVLKEIKKHSIDYRNKQIVWSNQDDITLMERSKVRIPVIDDRGVPPFYGNMDCQTLLEAYGLRKSEKLTANAAASAEQASQSEANAKASENNAKDSEENALSAAGRASESETKAKASETESKSSAESASSSATIAGQKADEAANSAAVASSSASSAAESKADATSAKEGAIAAKNSAETLKNEMQQSLDTAIEQAISAISLKMYPVGSIYMSVDFLSPAEFLGGTWETIRDRFLVGAGNSYSVNATGGEANHTLTESEMPSHSHNVSLSSAGSHHHRLWSGTDWADTVGSLARGDTYGVAGIARNANNQWCERSPKDSHVYMEDSGSHSHSVSENTKGLNSAHNNLPPYLAVYMWKRTA